MTKTKKVAKTTQTKTRKSVSTKAKVAAKKVDETQKAEVVKQTVISKREIKYNYPADMTATLERKAFRQKVRNNIKRLENKIAKAKSTTLKGKLQKELKAFQAEVLL